MIILSIKLINLNYCSNKNVFDIANKETPCTNLYSKFNPKNRTDPISEIFVKQLLIFKVLFHTVLCIKKQVKLNIHYCLIFSGHQQILNLIDLPRFK